jgi:AcrR family transcriptional regulator
MKRGRRPGETKTRDAIVDAARRSFARAGYDRTTIRAVAQDAGVDPALVMHFFATKEHLFAAAIQLPFDAESEIAALREAGREHFGEGLARLFFRVWEDPATGGAMVSLLRSASSHEDAAQRMRDLLDARIVQPLAGALDAPEARLRASLVSSTLVGLGFARYVLRLEPIASADPEVLIPALGRTLQVCLTEDIFNTG